MRVVVVALLAAAAVSCGGGGGGSDAPAPTPTPTPTPIPTPTPTPAPTPSGPATVTLSWNANRESGVNRAGGGYEVSLSGQPTRDLPYASGSAAPTSTVYTLPTGTYTASVRAYAALDAQGVANRTYSTASTFLVVVP
jgi:hypothetical protein